MIRMTMVPSRRPAKTPPLLVCARCRRQVSGRQPIDPDSMGLRALRDALGTYRRHQPDAVPSPGGGTVAKT